MDFIYHVEIARKLMSGLKRRDVEKKVKEAIEGRDCIFSIYNGQDIINSFPTLEKYVSSLKVYKEAGDKSSITIEGSVPQQNETGQHVQEKNVTGNSIVKANGHKNDRIIFKYYVFELNDDGEEAEYMDDEDESADPSAASHHSILPSTRFQGLWDSLIFEDDLRSRLMNYINSALLFSDKRVDSNLITWNKVILLYGPPGTGKTSLCKALAQKAVIRLSHRYPYGQFIEINSHSLFSKWFSESGKLVMKMFEKIHGLVEDPKSLVFLLIDEVESLAQCRQSAEIGNEPTDSIRAVNALLTQIDRIKRFPNVVILTTSNLVGSIDLAFVDRADLKIFIGPPPPEIIFGILTSSLNELIRVGIITVEDDYVLPCSMKDCNLESDKSSKKLFEMAKLSSGMSGRTLRKIPFLTHANFIHSTVSKLDTFLEAMWIAVEMEIRELDSLKQQHKA